MAADGEPDDDEAPKEDEAAQKSSSILLAGADDAEEPEDVDMAPAPGRAPSDTTDGLIGSSQPSMAPAAAAAAAPAVNSAVSGITGGVGGGDPTSLPTSIIVPSPFPAHNSSDRYRSALSRVQSSPLTDIEAWQAILTEASTSYRSISPHVHHISGGTQPPPGYDDLVPKLDWIESCFGAVLRYFPYSAAYLVGVCEVLMGQSALSGEEGGSGVLGHYPLGVGAAALTARQRVCEEKVERIFREALGVEMDGTAISGASSSSTAATTDSKNDDDEGGQDTDPFALRTAILGGHSTSSVELWTLYVRKRTRDAVRVATVQHSADATKNAELVREWTTKAYETALGNGAAYAGNNHLVWRAYVDHVKSWTDANAAAAAAAAAAPGGSDGTATMTNVDHALVQKRMATLRQIYQRLIGHPMTGLDQFWTEYEQFERAQSEQLAAALIGEFLPRYQHARSVYLERGRVWNVHELSVGRLAAPPVALPRGGASSGGGGGGAGAAGAGPAAGAGAGGEAGLTVESLAEYRTSLSDEATLLAKWKRRVSYERTNPERLPAAELARRVRSTYREMVSGLMRYPECWHGWAMWEMHHGGGGGGAGGGASGTDIAGGSAASKSLRRRVALSAAVLQLAQVHIPDCTLLAIEQSNLLERYRPDGTPTPCIAAMERFVERAGNALGYVTLERLVRRYGGVREAREVFSAARRTLRVRWEDAVEDGTGGAAVGLGMGDEEGENKAAGADDGAAAGEGAADADGAAGDDGARGAGKAAAAKAMAAARRVKESRMVTNRLGPNVGVVIPRRAAAKTAAAVTLAEEGTNDAAAAAAAVPAAAATITTIGPGYITHHVYSNHATIEHRINHCPHIAARIYELGLRKHRSFLSTPSYVLRYAALLLELNDEENLRALLKRAVAACEEELGSGPAAASTGDDKAAAAGGGDTSEARARMREAQRPLWDAMLLFESTLSTAQSGDATAAVQSIESRRRRALYGPDLEDVAGGDGLGDAMGGGDLGLGLGGGHNRASAGAAAGLSETLIRTDGYDASSRIANGMARLVDCLDVVGVWGDGGAALMGGGGGGGSSGALAAALSAAAAASSGGIAKDDGAGGASDASYRRRLKFQSDRRTMAALAGITGGPLGAGGVGGVGGGAGVAAGAAGAKVMTARERYVAQQQAQAAVAAQQAQAASGAHGGAVPDWLRPLLGLLPRLPPHRASARPPPHLIEMALASLQMNALPASRPEDGAASGGGGAGGGTMGGVTSPPADPRKRKRFDGVTNGGGGGGVSSDEENNGASKSGGGYGNQFRARQRSRMVGDPSAGGAAAVQGGGQAGVDAQ